MRLLAVHTFPVWDDTTAQEAWELCERGGRDEHPDVIGWANGEQRALLAADAGD